MKYLLLILLLSNVNSSFASVICKNYEVPKSYSSMKSEIQKELDQFANNKVIAGSADTMLSKLISAKSPFITQWYSKGNFAGKSEELVAQTWRQYYVEHFLMMQYPQDPKINVETEKLVDKQLKKYFTKQYKAKLEKLFKTSQDLAIVTVNEMALPQSKVMAEKIQNIKLYWPENLKTARNNAIPYDLIDWGIAYDPVPNEINIGLNSLIYSSDENYLAVFAHEIGHSFDPCRWGAFFEGPWPFTKVGECLRSEESVGAKKRDDSKLDEMGKAGKLPQELVNSLKANPTCNKMAYPSRGLQADQLPETFADWFSAEVISRVKNLDVTKLRLDLCEDKALSPGSSYVSNQMRQEKIYLAHPKIHSLLKKDEASAISGKYCSP